MPALALLVPAMNWVVWCVECEHFNLRGSTLAKHGFGLCKFLPNCTMQSATFGRSCERHRTAPAEKIEQRVAWLARKQQQDATP